MGEVCHAISRGSLMGARGNSGVILSQILRGLADEFRDRVEVRARPTLAHGLPPRCRRRVPGGDAPGRGHDPHRRARDRGGGRGARRRPSRSSTLLERGAATPRATRWRSTPDLLPVLREAGVVDAGGKGFTLLLDALLEVVDGTADPRARDRRDAGRGRRAPRGRRRRVGPALRGHVPARRARRRRCRRSATRGPRSATRSWWSAATASGTATCTPTTSAPRSRPASTPAGRATIRVTDLFEQVEEERWVREAEVVADLDGRRATRAAVTTAVVAVGVGDGMRRLLTSLGVQQRGRGRSVDEPVDRADPRGGRGVRGRLRDRAARTTRTSCRSPTRSTRSPRSTSRSSRPPACPRRSPRSSSTTRTPTVAENAATMRGRARARAHRRGHPGRARQRRRRRGAIRQGDWIALTRDGIVATDSLAGRRGVRVARRARRRRQRDRDGARRLPTPPRTRPSASASTSRSHVPAPRGRVPRRRPAALPVPRRRGVARTAVPHRRPAADAAGSPRRSRSRG